MLNTDAIKATVATMSDDVLLSPRPNNNASPDGFDPRNSRFSPSQTICDGQNTLKMAERVREEEIFIMHSLAAFARLNDQRELTTSPSRMRCAL
jgi:hypothetical protein